MMEVPCTEFDAGDVLLFRWRRRPPAKHAGIATDRGRMVHAYEGAAVVEVPLDRLVARAPGPSPSAFRDSTC